MSAQRKYFVKRSSSSARRRGMVWCGMDLTLAGDKWDVGGGGSDVVGVGRLGSGS